MKYKKLEIKENQEYFYTAADCGWLYCKLTKIYDGNFDLFNFKDNKTYTFKLEDLNKKIGLKKVCLWGKFIHNILKF